MKPENVEPDVEQLSMEMPPRILLLKIAPASPSAEAAR